MSLIPDHVKARLKVRAGEYLTSKGVDIRKPIRCPFHDDHGRPNASYDSKRHMLKCFAPGCTANDHPKDLFALIGHYENLPEYRDQVAFACRMFGEQLPTAPAGTAAPAAPVAPTVTPFEAETAAMITERRSFIQRAHENVAGTEYWQQRGISADMFDKFNLGFSSNSRELFGLPAAVVIPTGHEDGGFNLRNTQPGCEKNNRFRRRGRRWLFNAAALQKHEPVFLVEGEFDALSIETAGFNAVAMGGDNYRVLDELCAAGIDALPIIARDNDGDAGRTIATKAAEVFEARGITFYELDKLVDGELWGGLKDANEQLINAPAAFAQYLRTAVDAVDAAAAAASETYRAENNVCARLREFGEFLSSEPPAAIKTGFSCLDDILGGGLYEGLYVVGAVPSLGKTAFVGQIADAIAAHEHDVLFFSLEMSAFELMSRSISRLTFENAPHAASTATAVQYTRPDGERGCAIVNACGQYERTSAPSLFINEAVGRLSVNDICAKAREHYQYAGVAPVVVVDYLQILAATDPRATDKQNIDESMLHLKQLSRDLKTPVIIVSAFNRANDGSGVYKPTFSSFRESSAIEYTADVCVGLHLYSDVETDDIDERKRKSTRDVVATILKNRRGVTGGQVAYSYVAPYNSFTELGAFDGDGDIFDTRRR